MPREKEQPAVPVAVPFSRIEKAKWKAGSPEPASASAMEAEADDDDIQSDCDLASPPSSVIGTPTSKRGAASGRWSGFQMAGANDAYGEMDSVIDTFCEENGVSHERALKGYAKRHTLKQLNDNRWNTYRSMHSHPDHIGRELHRIGMSVQHFESLSAARQQTEQGLCWKAFKKQYTRVEIDNALALFQEFKVHDEQSQGTTLAKRQKVFSNLMSTLVNQVRILFYFSELDIVLIHPFI